MSLLFLTFTEDASHTRSGSPSLEGEGSLAKPKCPRSSPALSCHCCHPLRFVPSLISPPWQFPSKWISQPRQTFLLGKASYCTVEKALDVPANFPHLNPSSALTGCVDHTYFLNCKWGLIVFPLPISQGFLEDSQVSLNLKALCLKEAKNLTSSTHTFNIPVKILCNCPCVWNGWLYWHKLCNRKCYANRTVRISSCIIHTWRSCQMNFQ